MGALFVNRTATPSNFRNEVRTPCATKPPASHILMIRFSPQEPGVRVKRALHLISATKQAQEPGNTRLILGEYIADILLDARHNAKIFHWIVQRVGSAAIVYWGQEYTFDEAKTAAQSCLENLAAAQQKHA